MRTNSNYKYKGEGGSGLPRITEEQRLCVSVPEAAKMLGVSRNFAYELVRTNQLPVVRFGKRILIPKIQLQKRLEQGGDNER